MVRFKVLPRRLYDKDPEIVAKGLLGKHLVTRLGGRILSGFIVETEAYQGSDDPASRAYGGRKNYNSLKWDEWGVAFVYNVHKYWMFNIVARKPGLVGAVLVGAIELVEGTESMKKNRGIEETVKLSNGPGRLTVALRIDERLNRVPIYSERSEIMIADNKMDFNVGCSHAIGVKKDLDKKLRFFIEGNRFVSKQPSTKTISK